MHKFWALVSAMGFVVMLVTVVLGADMFASLFLSVMIFLLFAAIRMTRTAAKRAVVVNEPDMLVEDRPLFEVYRYDVRDTAADEDEARNEEANI